VLATVLLAAAAAPAAAQEPDWVRELEKQIERHAEAFARLMEEQFSGRGQREQVRDRRTGREVTETFSRTVRLGQNGTVEIENVAGDIVVTGGRGDDVTIEAVKRTRSANASAQDLLKEVQIVVTERGGNVEVRTQHPRRRNLSAAVDYTVSVPSDAHVTLRSTSGDLRISNVRGEVRAESTSGDISAASVERVRRLRSVSGTLQVTDAEGSEVDGGTVSGDVVVRNLRVRTINISTVSGALRFTDVESDRASLTSVSGSIEFTGRLARSGRYEFGTHSGSIRVIPAGNQGFDIEAATFSGNLRSDYSLSVPPGTTLGFQPGRPNRFLRGTVGDAGAALTLRSFSGDISIVRR
jgi:DUF4097 and DUF4098 domain-containing protein YvlB